MCNIIQTQNVVFTFSKLLYKKYIQIHSSIVCSFVYKNFIKKCKQIFTKILFQFVRAS